MTSIFDQYEQDCSKSDSSYNILKPSKFTATVQDLTSYAELEVVAETDVPIFNIQKSKSSPIVTHKITHFCVSNDKIVIAQENGTILFLSSNTESKTRELEISKFGGKIRNMFLDPVVGSHLLLTMSVPSQAAASFELCYVHVPSLKLKHLSKMHGHVVTAVGFSFTGSSQHKTSPILLGTSKGLIFEMEIDAGSDKLFASNVEQYCRQVFAIGRENNALSITGLEYHQFSKSSNKYFIICTTATRIYQFIGTVNSSIERPLLSQIFNSYLNSPEGFVEIPNDNSGSKLEFHYDISDASSVVAKSYGWYLDGIGIFYGKVEENVEDNASSVSVQNFVIKYNTAKTNPISFILTEFHAVLLYSNHITAISVIDKETVCSDYVDEAYGKLIAITKDAKTGNIWLCSDRVVFKCKVTKEDRHVWKIYLNSGEFELAKQYCSNNLFQFNHVLQRQAEQLFKDKRYEESAELYTNTQCSFGEIALKFLQASEINALKLYLTKKLQQLKPTQSSHVTMVTLWLIELYASQLAGVTNHDFDNECELRDELQDEFEKFLSMPQVNACVKANKEIVYKLLASYGDMTNLLKIAKLNKDYEKVIRHFINEKDVYEALLMLNDNSLPKDILQMYIPEMIMLAPKQMIDLLIKQCRYLNPCILLQTLIFQYENDDQALEVIRFLEYCVHSIHCREEEIHNYIITLYVKYKPDRLMPYLTMQGSEISVVNYDVKYALRLCQENNLTEACVQLSSLLGLWESAVELALTVNIDLAKQTISEVPHENTELCKKLWLKIAKHVVNECNDIKQAMEFLQQCDLIKIEDILPFFPDFTTIDNFKDAICSSLQEYNKNIELLKEEMEEAISSAEMIRSEIQDFKNKYTMIQSTDGCCSCSIQLLLRPFYAFPCGHRFHIDCLICELKPLLNESVYSKLQSLQRQLANVSSTADNVSASSSSLAIKSHLKSEINSIIAEECLFCGKPAIEQINRPFIEDDEFDRIKQDWE